MFHPREDKVFEQTIFLPKELPPRQVVDVVFNLTRGKLLKDRPDADLAGGAWLTDKRWLSATPPNVLRLRLDHLRERERGHVRVYSLGEQLEPTLFLFYDGPRDKPLPDGPGPGGPLPDPEPPKPEPPIPDPPWDVPPRQWWLEPLTIPEVRNLRVVHAGPQCAETPGFYCDLVPKDLDADKADLASLVDDPGPQGYLRQLKSIVDKPIGTSIHGYRKFFARYDANTHPDLFSLLGEPFAAPLDVDAGYAASQRGTDIGTVRALLQIALWLRWKQPDCAFDCSDATGYGLDYPAAVGAVAGSNMVERLSQLQLNLFQGVGSPSSGSVDIDAAREAFEMFANGELRLQLPNKFWTTQPSSGFFFYWALYAFLAVQLGVPDHAHWEGLLPGLVAAQEIFARVYAPHGSSRHLDDYRACNYDVLQVWTASEKLALRDQYQVLADKIADPSKRTEGLNELAAQMGQNLAAACPDGVPIVS